MGGRRSWAIEPDEYGGVVVPCNVELLHLLARSGYGAGSLPQAQVASFMNADSVCR